MILESVNGKCQIMQDFEQRKTKMSNTFLRTVLVLGMIIVANTLPIASCAQGAESKVQYRQISMEDYKDKVAGGWVGQAIGVLWGQWTEGRWSHSIVPFDLEDWYRLKPFPKELVDKATGGMWSEERRSYFLPYVNDKNNWEKWTPDKMADLDNLYIEFMFLHSIMNKGLDVTAKEIAEDRVKYLDPARTWGANKRAYRNFKKGIWPPRSGHPRLGNNYACKASSI